MGTETTGLSAAITRNIEQALNEKGLKKSDLVTRTSIPASTLYRNLKAPESFKVCDVGQIAAALDLELADIIFGRPA